MSRPLRAVLPGETVAHVPPKTLAEATERTRRELLVKSRLQIAQTLDDGVPAHALARLIAEMDRIDAEIRRLDLADSQEAARAGVVTDEEFDAQAI